MHTFVRVCVRACTLPSHETRVDTRACRHALPCSDPGRHVLPCSGGSPLAMI